MEDVGGKCNHSESFLADLMKNLVVWEDWSMFVIKTNLLHYSMHSAFLFLYVVIILTSQIKCNVRPTFGCSYEGEAEVTTFAVELRKMVHLIYIFNLTSCRSTVINSIKYPIVRVTILKVGVFLHDRKHMAACCTHQL